MAAGRVRSAAFRVFEGDPAAQHWLSAPKAAQAAFQSIEAIMMRGLRVLPSEID